MTLSQLRQNLSEIHQTLPLGRTLEQEELICHLAGLVLDREGILHLVALEDDPAYSFWLEEQQDPENQNLP